MKRMKISPLLTVAIATQMIVSPFAHAQNALQGVQMLGQILQQNQQNVIAQRNAQANQQLVGQLTEAGPDKHFRGDVFSRIPGLNQYLASSTPPIAVSCLTLPTTLTEIRAEVCRLGVTNDRGVPPQAQLGEMFSLHKTYGDVAKAYDNYRQSTNSVDRQAFGVGCMKNAMQGLNGFMSTRITDLDNLMKDIALMHDQFKERSRVDLDAIEESTAVLEGGNSELADEVRSRRPDLFDFSKRFDNPACKSMYAGDAINNIGKGSPGGLNQINKNMRDQFSGKAQGAKFSGESYMGAHSTVVEDINKMANSAAEQFKLNFQGITGEADGFSKFLGDLPNAVSSSSGLNRSQFSADFFADVQQKFNKQNSDIVNDLSIIQDDLRAAGADPSAALRLASNLNAKNFENEVSRVQNQIRNGCVQRAFSGENFWDDIRKNIKDPQASKFANKNEFNPLRKRIQDIMTNPQTTPESKIAQLRNLEQAEGGRFILNAQGSYQKTTIVNGKAVITNELPSSSAPSKYFSDVVTTCDAEFSVQKLGTMTGAGAVQKLRELNTQYKNLASSQMNNIRNEIRNKLINCENSAEANNQQAGSCNRDRFNTNAQGFCANAAFTCANNMKSCSTQAENFVKQIKTERTARVQNYKRAMEANKQQIKGMVAKLVNDYSAIGSAIAGLNLGASFAPPTPDYDIKGDGKFLDSFKAATAASPDGALLLEDPDKYFQLMKTNVEKLKASFAKTQQELAGRGGVLAQHIDQTEKNYAAAQRKAEEISNNCIAKHDDYVRQAEAQMAQQRAEQQKKMNELGERRQQVCELFNRAQTDANGACAERIRDVVGVSSIYGQFRDGCRQGGFHNETPNDRDSSNAMQAATDICAERGFSVVRRSASTPAPASPAAATPAASTAATPAAATPGQARANAEDDIRYLCARLGQFDCQPEPAEREGDRARVSSSCISQGYTSIVTLNRQVRNSGSDSGPASFPDAPADCRAGFNGDRNDGGSRTDQILREFGIASGSSVQGL